MVDDPLWEALTYTIRTLQQVGSRELVDQRNGYLDMLKCFSVDGSGCGGGQLITQFVDGCHCGSRNVSRLWTNRV